MGASRGSKGAAACHTTGSSNINRSHPEDVHDSRVGTDGYLSLVTSDNKNAFSDGALYSARVTLSFLLMLPRTRSISGQVVSTTLFTTSSLILFPGKRSFYKLFGHAWYHTELLYTKILISLPAVAAGDGYKEDWNNHTQQSQEFTEIGKAVLLSLLVGIYGSNLLYRCSHSG